MCVRDRERKHMPFTVFVSINKEIMCISARHLGRSYSTHLLDLSSLTTLAAADLHTSGLYIVFY